MSWSEQVKSIIEGAAKVKNKKMNDGAVSYYEKRLRSLRVNVQVVREAMAQCLDNDAYFPTVNKLKEAIKSRQPMHNEEEIQGCGNCDDGFIFMQAKNHSVATRCSCMAGRRISERIMLNQDFRANGYEAVKPYEPKKNIELNRKCLKIYNKFQNKIFSSSKDVLNLASFELGESLYELENEYPERGFGEYGQRIIDRIGSGKSSDIS